MEAFIGKLLMINKHNIFLFSHIVALLETTLNEWNKSESQLTR